MNMKSFCLLALIPILSIPLNSCEYFPIIENSENSGVVILSKKETANCYIAPTNGRYSFNAAVRGNSTESVGDAFSAEVIWETTNTGTKPSVGDVISGVKLAKGVVYFETTENDGNALIAVKNEDGVILWSWHIWVTDYNPSSDFDTYVGFEGTKVMNRNLGALSNEKGDKSLGLVYQWGRKDPFMGFASFGTFACTGKMRAETTSEIIGTDDYAISHPDTYIFGQYQGSDWRYEPDTTAWGATKTVFDPCPAGWKVPSGGEDGLWGNFKTGFFDYGNGGMIFGSDCATPDVWMPAQGYIGDSDWGGNNWWVPGSEGRYWTTTTLGDYHSEYFIFSHDKIQASHIDKNEWGVHCGRANGMPIRCVEDK